MDTASDQRIIVTGAAGFIGFHVSKRLLELGRSVLGIDSLNGYYDPALKRARLEQLRSFERFRAEIADLSDYPRTREIFDTCRPTQVVHLAAQAGVRYSLENPRAYVTSNVDAFLSVLEAVRHLPVRHFIYASSSSVYGANNKLPFSESDRADYPVSLYAATKRSNELMAYTYAHLFRIPATGLRFFTVYGPWGRPDMAYYSFTKAIFEGTPIRIYNNGQMSRDFTYIDDVVEAIVRLIDTPPSQGIGAAEATADVPHRLYNIGNHTPVQLERFIEIIEAVTGRSAEKVYVPMQPGDVPATYADVDALAEAVGFAPSTSLESGIGRFVEWYRAYHRMGA
jgi:UDP-glucuronate 4-epimerase